MQFRLTAATAVPDRARQSFDLGKLMSSECHDAAELPEMLRRRGSPPDGREEADISRVAKQSR